MTRFLGPRRQTSVTIEKRGHGALIRTEAHACRVRACSAYPASARPINDVAEVATRSTQRAGPFEGHRSDVEIEYLATLTRVPPSSLRTEDRCRSPRMKGRPRRHRLLGQLRKPAAVPCRERDVVSEVVPYE